MCDFHGNGVLHLDVFSLLSGQLPYPPTLRQREVSLNKVQLAGKHFSEYSPALDNNQNVHLQGDEEAKHGGKVTRRNNIDPEIAAGSETTPPTTDVLLYTQIAITSIIHGQQDQNIIFFSEDEHSTDHQRVVQGSAG